VFRILSIHVTQAESPRRLQKMKTMLPMPSMLTMPQQATMKATRQPALPHLLTCFTIVYIPVTSAILATRRMRFNQEGVKELQNPTNGVLDKRLRV
jgi:hypothetical protein